MLQKLRSLLSLNKNPKSNFSNSFKTSLLFKLITFATTFLVFRISEALCLSLVITVKVALYYLNIACINLQLD